MLHQFHSDEIIAETGVYQVIHKEHRLPLEVILLQDAKFPRCAKCEEPVIFELVTADPAVFLYQPLRVFALPVLEPRKAATDEGQ